jgi:DNA-3-methyladenine glycosylase II
MSRACQITPTVVIEAQAYLSQSCRVMAGLIRTHGPCPLADREFRPFQTLANSIISQQLSAKAADTIERRVQAIVPGFTPAGFLAVPRGATRCRAVIGQGPLYPRTGPACQRWAAEPRGNAGSARRGRYRRAGGASRHRPMDGGNVPDLRPSQAGCVVLGDAGLQRAARLLFGDDAKLERVGQSWRPFCSVASWYLWRHLD